MPIEFEPGPDFVPGLPHVVAHSRRYVQFYTVEYSSDNSKWTKIPGKLAGNTGVGSDATRATARFPGAVKVLSPRTLSLFYIENTSVHRKLCRRIVCKTATWRCRRGS